MWYNQYKWGELMELILIVVVVIMLCLSLGINAELILVGMTALLALFLVAMFLLFAYSIFRMLTAEKTVANFLRIDKNPNGKFDVAYYKIENEEYSCAFPSEIVMKKKLYSGDKQYKVRINKKTKRIYDKNASITCITGFVFSSLMMGLVVFLIKSLNILN